MKLTTIQCEFSSPYFSYKENIRKGMVFRNREVITHPTVVIVTNAHQKPSHVPLMKGLGNSSGFLRRSCITKINGAHHDWWSLLFTLKTNSRHLITYNLNEILWEGVSICKNSSHLVTMQLRLMAKNVPIPLKSHQSKLIKWLDCPNRAVKYW